MPLGLFCPSRFLARLGRGGGEETRRDRGQRKVKGFGRRTDERRGEEEETAVVGAAE
jgi:hypothetical protein